METDTVAGTVRRTVERWRRSRRLRLVGLAAAAYLAGALVVDPAARAVGVPVGTAAGFVLALGVSFGSTVAVGAGLGRVLADVLTGTFGLHSAFGYAAAFHLVFLTVAIWNALGPPRPFEYGVRDVVRFVAAALPGIVAAATVLAWGGEVLARSTFAAAMLASFGDAVGTVAVGLAALPVAKRLAAFGVPGRPPDPQTGLAFSKGWAVATTAVVVSWGALGTVLSVGLQPFQLESDQILANQFGWSAVAVLDVAGPAGRNLQLALGLVAFGVLTAAVASVRRS